MESKNRIPLIFYVSSFVLLLVIQVVSIAIPAWASQSTAAADKELYFGLFRGCEDTSSECKRIPSKSEKLEAVIALMFLGLFMIAISALLSILMETVFSDSLNNLKKNIANCLLYGFTAFWNMCAFSIFIHNVEYIYDPKEVTKTPNMEYRGGIGLCILNFILLVIIAVLSLFIRKLNCCSGGNNRMSKYGPGMASMGGFNQPNFNQNMGYHSYPGIAKHDYQTPFNQGAPYGMKNKGFSNDVMGGNQMQRGGRMSPLQQQQQMGNMRNNMPDDDDYQQQYGAVEHPKGKKFQNNPRQQQGNFQNPGRQMGNPDQGYFGLDY